MVFNSKSIERENRRFIDNRDKKMIIKHFGFRSAFISFLFNAERTGLIDWFSRVRFSPIFIRVFKGLIRERYRVARNLIFLCVCENRYSCETKLHWKDFFREKISILSQNQSTNKFETTFTLFLRLCLFGWKKYYHGIKNFRSKFFTLAPDIWICTLVVVVVFFRKTLL